MMRSILIFFALTTALYASDYQVLGLGCPCVDYILHVTEKELVDLDLKKGGWKGVDAREFSALIDAYAYKKKFTGDCASNTIKGLSSLGVSCALTGNIGSDSVGDFIRQALTDLNVTTLFTETTSPSCQVACLISEDGERSFISATQAEHEISSADLDPAHFENVQLVHTEGFRLLNDLYLEKAMEMAQSAGSLISIDLAHAGLIEKFRERIWALLETYTDIVFVNEEEAYALTHLPPDRAAKFLFNFCSIAVVKVGERGCWVCSSEGLIYTPSYSTDVIDCTGSGDLFASAFLYGYLNEYSLEKCSQLGNLAGSAAVESFGAELSSEKWKAIRARFPQN